MNYKLTYLTADNEDKTPLKTIEEAGGKILKEEGLGQRKLAYKIDKNQAAFYQVIYFSLDEENLAKLRGEIKSDANIIRDLITKTSLPRQEKAKTSKIEPAESEKIPSPLGSVPVSSAPVETAEKIEKVDAEKKMAEPKQKIETKTVKPAPVVISKAKTEKIEVKTKENEKKKVEESKKRLEELDKKLEEILKI